MTAEPARPGVRATERLCGGDVRLRVPSRGDAAILAAMRTASVTAPWDFFDEPPHELIDGDSYGGGGRMVELADGTVVGAMSFIQIPYGPNLRSLAWRIGVTVLPEYRNRGVASAAQRLLSDILFAASEANRVEADTDVENIAEQRALEAAGFRREGVLRGAQWRAGAWHDHLLYARLRDD